MTRLFKLASVPYLVVLALTAVWYFMYLSEAVWDAQAWLEVTRLTARTSVCIFLLGFTAKPLLKLTQLELFVVIVRIRRHVALAFALGHFIHLGVLMTYFQISDESPEAIVVVVGGATYVMIFLMAITSNNWSQRRLGSSWRKLHLAGSWMIWLVFLNSYMSRVLADVEPHAVFSVITTLLMLSAAGRLMAASRRVSLPKLQG